MPHLSARVPEAELAGREEALVAGLTDAVVDVYGAWARDLVVVHLEGVAANRWATGGRPMAGAMAAITFGVRQTALDGPGGADLASRLAASVTDAAVAVLGEQARSGTTVELVAVPPGRSAVGGLITD